MSVRKGAIVLSALLVPGLLAAWLVTGRPQAQRPTAPQVPPATVAAVAQAGTGLVQARQIHDQLLAEAEALPTPNSMPLPNPPALPVSEQPLALAPPSDVPPERQLSLAFTGNVVGETDPCG